MASGVLGSGEVDPGAPLLLVISFTDLARDPRVRRQLRFLREVYRVTAAGFGDPRLAGVSYVPIPPPPGGLARWRRRLLGAGRLARRRFERFYWTSGSVPAARAALSGVRADAVLANDIDTLPLALELANGAKVVFDAHEYAPREYDERILWRALVAPYRRYLCAQYVPKVNAMMTVGPAIAAEYERDTGVRPTVITNAPDFVELAPRPAAPNGVVRLVHHGGANPSRRLEDMVDAMAMLDDRFELTMMLVELPGHERYLEHLRRRARRVGRVEVVPPAPMEDLPKTLNAFDVGVYLLAPANYNQRYALPNKLFEYVQARLAVVVGPSPEMARVVEEHGCGVVADDFSVPALARALGHLDAPTIQRFKAAAHRCARALSADGNAAAVQALVRQALES